MGFKALVRSQCLILVQTGQLATPACCASCGASLNHFSRHSRVLRAMQSAIENASVWDSGFDGGRESTAEILMCDLCGRTPEALK
eukprot:6489693-Amphidinium_carterae.1